MSLLNIVKYFLRLLKPLLMTTHSSPYHTPTRKGHFHFHPLSKEVGRVGGRTPPTSHYYYLPSFGGVGHSPHQQPSTGMEQEIHPSGQGKCESIKIKPSLLRMRE